MRSGASSRPTGSEVGHAVGRSSPRRPCAPMARSAPGPGPRAGALAARRGGDDRGPLLSSRSGPRHVPSPAARSRIRLEAQDTALSRRRSPVRIRYAVPTSHTTRCSGSLRTTPQHLVVPRARADRWSLIWSLIQARSRGFSGEGSAVSRVCEQNLNARLTYGKRACGTNRPGRRCSMPRGGRVGGACRSSGRPGSARPVGGSF